MIISLGIDCGVTFYLKEEKLRTIALPFDWVVTYNGVADLIKNNFKNFKENVLMPHHSFPKDIEKYIRRMKRFNELLNGNEEIIFIRKGHSEYHHSECNNIKCDILDSFELNTHLLKLYPNLKYKINLYLLCNKCYTSGCIQNTSNLEIHFIKNNCTDHHQVFDTFKNYILKLI